MSKILGGGGDRFDTRPLTPEGSRDPDDNPNFDNLRGCHVGTSFGLNILGGPPGHTPIWIRNNKRDAMIAKQRGGLPASHFESTFSVGSQELDGLKASPLDSSDTYEDVTLFFFPDEVLRKEREQQIQRSKAQLRGSAEEFVSRATPAEIQFSGGRPSRFARRDHVTEVRSGFDESAQLEEVWAPDRGIVD